MNIKSFLGNLAKAYLVVSALSVSAYAGAENSYNGQPAWACPPPPCAPVCAPACNEPPHCDWGYNPPAYAKCGNGSTNFFDSLGFRVDFLYWRASADELALGIEERNSPYPGTPDCCNSPTQHNYVKRSDFSFDPGFRLGLSHFCPCAGWDSALNWTHYHTKSHIRGFSDNLALSTTGPTVNPQTIPFTLFVPYWEQGANLYPDQIMGRYKLEADWVDLELGHKYYVSSCFVMRPQISIRAARIDQTFHITSSASRGFDGAGSVYFGASNRYQSQVRVKNDFYGAGPRIGVGLEFDLGCGFSIVGDVAGSILFGRAKKHGRESISGISATTGLPIAGEYSSNGTRSDSSRLMSDLALGVKWDHCLNWCNQSHIVTFAILWEHHGFYRFNQFDFDSNAVDITTGLPPTTATAARRQPHGDIFTQGLTVALNVGF